MFWRGNFKLFIDIAVGGEKGEGGGVGSIRNILKTLLYFEFKFIYTVQLIIQMFPGPLCNL